MAVIPELQRYLKISFSHSNLPDGSGENQEASVSKQQVYVSLTTLPGRINKIRATIHSLLDQTIVPTKIIINIPEVSREGIPYVVPGFLNEHKRIHIHPLQKDLGPASKLLPTLQNDSIHPDGLIVVVDDDQVYPKKLIENYLTYAKEYPGHALTLCGWSIPTDLNHSSRKILRAAGLKITVPYANIKQAKQVEVIQGASSFAVKKSFFNNDIFNYESAPDGAFFADDIWISGHLAKNKIPKTVIKADFSYCRFESFSHLRTKGLRDTANADNSNNNQLYHFFRQDWVLYE